ncbi:hypothetical protein HRR83_007259 [Exophiala dermatitidis]|uniref:C3H1-type domain-containing protein n=2 Tax=Exophiala dermatitidis TaxID=5970 RepID=H6C412_EXODN|nr:uncharacterized protein HMPREF1120_06388 [Exophiala dermatitidis NIH/UT8656]KAJ4509065.1 hypothetical protein HRR75_006034 [Exophiala dermatitidis]EHY58377.1 hypothetical protein HMPREF1120_06388 [Exophiala dermatitidis NIH/UT8656]KAJ4511217.1 hypothetical protein HRR73_006550 [Exophiala dermatitidis]KAJ4511847.1 hypothetical protein HRR74_006581 [Exophiala dermatitidis]KAJ4534703.1 hypothetical protein HRR76_006617 [Exophiala dermatitidis]
MAILPNEHELRQRLQDFSAFDQARQFQFESLTNIVLELNKECHNLKSDLEDERNTRRTWKRRAEEAEASTQRKFVVVLVDGDGYIFRRAFLQAVTSSGGSKAANELYTEVLNNLRQDEGMQGLSPDCDVLVNVYANKAGLARTLAAADYLNAPYQIDHFFCSFTQSRSLFQFIDCGPGKERVDAKLRDTFRFYAYNAQCQRIYLACCHDNGYIAELDKYRHDATVMPKVMLVEAAQSAAAVRAYASLPFKSTRFDTVFETSALDITARAAEPSYAAGFDGLTLDSRRSSPEQTSTDLTPSVSRSTYSSISSPPGLPLPVSSNTTLTTQQPAKPPTPPAEVMPTTTTTQAPIPTLPVRAQSNKLHDAGAGAGASETTTANNPKSGIPVNRLGQRIDLKIRMPSSAELDRFEDRIRDRRKLCNEHHLRDNCESYSCRYDHDPIDPVMRSTLRYKARSIPCAQGSKCRRQDCFYGHRCPWGNNGNCGNPKCAFDRMGLHDVKDLEIAKLVPAQPVAGA